VRSTSHLVENNIVRRRHGTGRGGGGGNVIAYTFLDGQFDTNAINALLAT
jgi:hypothetical protein